MGACRLGNGINWRFKWVMSVDLRGETNKIKIVILRLKELYGQELLVYRVPYTQSHFLLLLFLPTLAASEVSRLWLTFSHNERYKTSRCKTPTGKHPWTARHHCNSYTLSPSEVQQGGGWQHPWSGQTRIPVKDKQERNPHQNASLTAKQCLRLAGWQYFVPSFHCLCIAWPRFRIRNKQLKTLSV